MSFVHIYRAKSQPATRYAILLLERRHWTKNPPNRLLPAMCCSKRRPAKNLVAQVYYDGTWFYCRDAKGCRA